MNINKIDHISIAVKDLEAAKLIWQPVLGKTEPDESYEDNTEQIRVARYYVGDLSKPRAKESCCSAWVSTVLRTRAVNWRIRTIRWWVRPDRFATANSTLFTPVR